jgi:ferritin
MDIKKPSLSDKILTNTKDNPRLKPEMYNALNGQIVIEFNTVSLFQSMYAWCEGKGFKGASKFFQNRVKEEQMHVNKVYQYILDKGMLAVTPTIQSPTTEYIDLYDITESCRLYQVGVTQSYEKIGELAISLGDHTTYNFIQFFLEDQIKEEATFITLCDQYKILSQGGMTGLAWIELDEMFEDLVEID